MAGADADVGAVRGGGDFDLWTDDVLVLFAVLGRVRRFDGKVRCGVIIIIDGVVSADRV